jgi:hypothetical protein
MVKGLREMERVVRGKEVEYFRFVFKFLLIKSLVGKNTSLSGCSSPNS